MQMTSKFPTFFSFASQFLAKATQPVRTTTTTQLSSAIATRRQHGTPQTAQIKATEPQGTALEGPVYGGCSCQCQRFKPPAANWTASQQFKTHGPSTHQSNHASSNTNNSGHAISPPFAGRLSSRLPLRHATNRCTATQKYIFVAVVGSE
jgi:hypothetical protein